MSEAEEVFGPGSSWVTSQEHLQTTEMVLLLCKPVWEEAFTITRHIWRAGSSSGLPSTMHGRTGDGPKKGHEDSEGPETSDIQREAKRAEPAQPGEEKAQGTLNTVHKHLLGGIKNDGFFQRCPGTEWAQTEIWEMLFKCKKNVFFTLGMVRH